MTNKRISAIQKDDSNFLSRAVVASPGNETKLKSSKSTENLKNPIFQIISFSQSIKILQTVNNEDKILSRNLDDDTIVKIGAQSDINEDIL